MKLNLQTCAYRDLLLHLIAESQSSKATVAREFDFHDAQIYTLMAKIYIKRGYGYENANELCVDLFDNEDVEKIDDIAHLVNNLVLGKLKLEVLI